jgi:hydroxymethylbilane synthase
LSRLRIRVYDQDPGTVPRIGGVLQARARARVEIDGVPGHLSGPGEPGGAGADGWLESLAQGEVDLAICPVEAVRDTLDDRIVITGVPERGDPRDVLLGPLGGAMPLARLPTGSAVATWSKRTTGLLRAHRPDLVAVQGTELAADLARVDGGELAAVVTSYNRIAGTSDVRRVGEAFPVTAWIPAPGQGALAILTRRGETGAIEVAEHLVHSASMRAVRAEIALAQLLDVEPGAALGVIARPFPGGMRLWGMVVGVDGLQVVRGDVSANGGPPEQPAADLHRILAARGAGRVGVSGS